MSKPSEEWLQNTAERAAEVYETAAATKGEDYAEVLRFGATISTTVSTLHQAGCPRAFLEHISADLFGLLGYYAHDQGVDLSSTPVRDEFMRTVLLMGPVLLEQR